MITANEINAITIRQTIIEAVEAAGQERGVDMLPEKRFNTSSKSLMRFAGSYGRDEYSITIRVTRKEDTLSWYILMNATSGFSGVRQYQQGTGSLTDLRAAVADATDLTLAQPWEWSLINNYMAA